MSIFPEKTVSEVLAALDPVELLKLISYRLDTLQEIQDQVKCFCPIHREAVFRTLIIDRERKDYRCSYSLCPGNPGGNLIDLYAKVNEISADDALQELVEKLSLDVELPPTAEILQRLLEEGENFVYLLGTEESRPELYLEEAHKRFQRILEVDPSHPKGLRGLYKVLEYKGETEKLPELSRKRIAAEHELGRNEEVIALCRNHLELESESVDVRRHLVQALLKLERQEEAVTELMALAELCELQEDFDGALQAYRKVAELDVIDIDVHPMIVNLLESTGRRGEAVAECIARAHSLMERAHIAEAMEVLRSTLEIDSSRDDVRAKLVECHLALGLDTRRIHDILVLVDEMIERDALEPASNVLQTLCEADPSRAILLDKLLEVKKRQGLTEEVLALQYRLADLYRDQEDYASATLVLEEILATDPDDLQALERTAEINHLEGDHAEAVSIFRRMAELAREQGDLEAAISAAERMIDIQPDAVENLELRIDLYTQAGRNDDALQQTLHLLNALEKQGDTDRLVARMRSALELAPDRIDLRIRLAEALDMLGEIAEGLDQRTLAAHGLLQQEHFDDAIEQLDFILARRPDDLEALAHMAEALAWTGKKEESQTLFLRLAAIHTEAERYAEARESLEKLLDRAPEHVQALESLLDCYTGLGDEAGLVETLERLEAIHRNAKNWDEAQRHIESILDLQPEHIEAHRSLAFVHEQQGRTDDALRTLLHIAELYRERSQTKEERETLTSVLDRDPANSPALRRLVILHLDAEEPEEALALVDQLLDAAHKQISYDEAVEFLRSLLQRDPENLDYHARLIDALRDAGRNQEVIAQLQELIDLHQAHERFDPIADLYRQALEIEPDNLVHRANLIDTLLRLERRTEAVDEYLLLADEYEKLDRHEDAEQVGQEILKIDPANEPAHRKLIHLAQARGQTERAVEWVARLAEQQAKNDNTDQALRTLQETFELDPDNIPARRRLSELEHSLGHSERAIELLAEVVALHQKAGDSEQAAQVQREIIQLDPENPQLRRALVDILIKCGDTAPAVAELFAIAQLQRTAQQFDDVLQILEEILQHDPESLRARKLRSEIYIETGREKEALKELLSLTERLEDPQASQAVAETRETGLPEALPLVEEYTFENFVVGDRNNFAYATALATAKAPAKQYNPLFLYSDVGLGKTHLMHAIGNYIREHSPKLRVLYSTAEEFTSQLIDAIQNNRVPQFHQAHRAVDVLLLDDVQFLAGKERAQTEFFHIFNTLFQAKKQIVVTSDRPPKEIAHLEKRLKSRFGAGIVVDIHTPDVETRTAIIKREVQAHPQDLGFTPDIISLIAQKIETNVRELKGALRQVTAACETTGDKLTSDLVSRVLDQFLERV